MLTDEFWKLLLACLQGTGFNVLYIETLLSVASVAIVGCTTADVILILAAAHAFVDQSALDAVVCVAHRTPNLHVRHSYTLLN